MTIRLFVISLLVAASVMVFAGRRPFAEEQVSESQAIAEIHKLGGKVGRDEESPGRPVVSVEFQGMRPLVGSVRPFDRQSRVTDSDLDHLQGLTQLRELRLQRTQVTDSGLAHIRGLTQLQTLDLWGTPVTDAGLEHLKGLTRLRLLDLEGTRVTECGIGEIEKALPNLTILGVARHEPSAAEKAAAEKAAAERTATEQAVGEIQNRASSSSAVSPYTGMLCSRR